MPLCYLCLKWLWYWGERVLFLSCGKGAPTGKEECTPVSVKVRGTGRLRVPAMIKECAHSGGCRGAQSVEWQPQNIRRGLI